jgi:hypothetical protein
MANDERKSEAWRNGLFPLKIIYDLVDEALDGKLTDAQFSAMLRLWHKLECGD